MFASAKNKSIILNGNIHPGNPMSDNLGRFHDQVPDKIIKIKEGIGIGREYEIQAFE